MSCFSAQSETPSSLEYGHAFEGRSVDTPGMLARQIYYLHVTRKTTQGTLAPRSSMRVLRQDQTTKSIHIDKH